MKVLFVTSEWPSKDQPNHVPFLKDNILSFKSKGIKISIYKIKSESIVIRLISIIQLRKQIRDKKYDIIHIHWGYNGLYCLGLNIPNVVTFHGSDLNKPFSWKTRSIITYIISKISTVTSQHNIFVSKGLVKQSLLKKKKMTIIPMGIDLDKFFPMDKKVCREKLNFPINKHLILFGGNSSQVIKRLSLAKSALKYLDDNYKLITIDYVDHNLIPIYMNACDMLLMTSLSEGSPTMIKEAMACNLPIVSTNVGDVKEQLQGLENCFIIKNETPEEIASVVKKCIKNQVVPNGRAKMLNFSVNVLSNEIIKIYRSLLL